MAYVPIGNENKHNLELHFTDRGAGDPVLLIHGYPFAGVALERQEAALIEAGYRVITYDRRGFGESSKPSMGFDYDTFASDLKAVIEFLELSNVTLIGHSMGTSEIARYIGTYGTQNIARAVMISPIPPFLLKTDDNSTGVEMKVFDTMKASIKKDRFAHLAGFLKTFYSTGIMGTDGVSEEKLKSDFILGSQAGSFAFLNCVDSWLEDFRVDVTKIDIPLLIIHGDADKILPISSTAKVLKEIVGELVVIAGGSHGIPWTHADEVNEAILNFMPVVPAFGKGLGTLSPDSQASVQ